LSRRLGVIIAPAGFGKTTLMVQWQARLCAKGAQVGWLSCDEEDGDPLQLLSYMILALAEAGVDLGALRGASERGMLEGAVRQTTAEVLEKIEDARGDVVLILDDYHRLGTREADKLLIQLLDAAPPNFTIVLSTRAQPKFDLARLLAIGWASEFDAGSLRLSKQELGEAFDRALTPAERDILFERTEGWIIAVQLARLMMEEGQSIEACLASFKGDVGHIATYLAEQVLGNLPEDLQNFLIETSVLDAFNASLADALVIRNDSADVLKRLEPLSALLSPISDQPGWYRYHQLFAECLQDLQRRRSGADTSQLHLRASMWFEKRGDVVAAVNHASEAADFDRCARLIEEAGGSFCLVASDICAICSNAYPMRSCSGFQGCRSPRPIFVQRTAISQGQGHFLIWLARTRWKSRRARPCHAISSISERFSTYTRTATCVRLTWRQ